LSYNEAKAVTDTAFADGKRDEKFETAKAMLAEGFDVTTVARITKLTESEIENLK
jgi:predicted transposase/invertase (TIGR01784 family)